MRIAIIHLSDLHLRTIEDPILERVDALRAAIVADAPSITACILLISGDVAFSGQKSEYEVAELFLDALCNGLRTSIPKLPIDEIHVPGNHDCDFTKPSRVRQLIIDDILKNQGVNSDDDDVLAPALMVQDEYYAFLRRRMGEPKVRHGLHRLFWSRTLVFGKVGLVFHCFNTAWMSQLKEKQGELVPIAGDALEASGDVCISVFHHPYNWLQSEVARSFKRRIEAASDLIFTGHEHDPYLTQILNGQGQVTTSIEGGVLQEHNDKISSFHIVNLDLTNMSHWISTYAWQDGLYTQLRISDSIPLTRHLRESKQELEFREPFYKELANPGAHYRHPVRSPLLLWDFFVFPQIESFNFRSASKEVFIHSSSDLFDSETSWLIVGEDKSGKTALARYACHEWRKRGVVPLLISGADLKHAADERKLNNSIEHAIAHAYGKENLDRYKQKDKCEKVLIIDDLDDAGLNRQQLNRALELFGVQFSRIVAFASPFFPFVQQSQQSDESDSLFGFQLKRMLPFGHGLRGKLIEKWYSLGRLELDFDQEFYRKIKGAEDFVKQMLGRSLLPRYPSYILTILQLYEAGQPNSPVSGVFGYYYERLITQSIDGAYESFENKGKLPTQDAMRAFLSLVALRMFEDKRTRISRSVLDEVFLEHKRRLGSLRPELVLPFVSLAELLVEDESGAFMFAYDYAYFFFLAFYLSENLHREQYAADVRQKIAYIASRLHVDAYSRTLVFLVYLTKDEQILRSVIDHARGIFVDYRACDLASDVKPYNELVSSPGAVELRGRSMSQHLQSIREVVEEEEKAELATRFDYSEEDADSELEEVLKLTVAFRTVQVLGQILRNAPGSLDVTVKEAATRECFLLSLRTLSFLNKLLSGNIEEFRKLYGSFLKNELKVADPLEIAKRIDSYVFATASVCAYSLIKRASLAIGSEHLEETYDHVGDLQAPIATGLINVAIRLDHFKSFPDAEVKLVGKATKASNNWIAFNVLRQLIVDHFVMFARPMDLRSRVCGQLDIRETPSFMTRELKA